MSEVHALKILTRARNGVLESSTWPIERFTVKIMKFNFWLFLLLTFFFLFSIAPVNGVMKTTSKEKARRFAKGTRRRGRNLKNKLGKLTGKLSQKMGSGFSKLGSKMTKSGVAGEERYNDMITAESDRWSKKQEELKRRREEAEAEAEAEAALSPDLSNEEELSSSPESRVVT